MTSRAGWRGPAILLAVAVGLGFALRVAPCWNHPDFQFMSDGRYHERLTRQVVTTGRLAGVDSLSNAPLGRRTASHLPLGLYHVGATIHRGLSALGSQDLRWNLALLQALAGALIALPVWLGATAVFGDRRAAAAAALLVVLLPAHLHRTQGIVLRYDSLGTLLVTTHAALALAALAGFPRRRWLAIGSALAFVTAMSVWRVSLLVLELELLCAAIWFLARGPQPALRELWLVLAVVGTLGLLPIPYLAEHRFLLSPPWLAVVGFAIALALPGLASPRRWPLRLGVLAIVGVAAMMWGRLESAADYAGLTHMLATRLGWARAHDPDAALMRTVIELQGMPLRRLLTSGEVFSWLGVVFVASPLLFASLAGQPTWRMRLPAAAAPATLAALGVGLFVATLLFQRSSVLLAPFLAIVIGGLAARAWSAATDARSAARNAGRIVLALLAIGTVGALMGAARAVTNPNLARIAPNEAAAIEFIHTHAPSDAIVLSDWDAGYEIQSRTGRATVVDGLLESAENRQRIVELYRALMDPGSARLEALCDRHGATWLLLPNSSAIYAMAAVTGDPLAEVLARGEAVPRGPLTDHLIVHLIEGASYPRLRPAMLSGGFTVFEIMGGAESAAPDTAVPASNSQGPR